MDVKTQCKHLLIICFDCVYFGMESVVILPHLYVQMAEIWVHLRSMRHEWICVTEMTEC